MDFDQAVSFKVLLYEQTTDLTARKPPPSTPSSSVIQTEQQQRAARGLRFGAMQSKAVAGPSASTESPITGEVTALGSIEGKRKAVEAVVPSRPERRVALSRQRLEEELADVRGEGRAWQAAESHAREMAAQAAEKERELQLRIETLDP